MITRFDAFDRRYEFAECLYTQFRPIRTKLVGLGSNDWNQ
jgi:hypothetical protein